MDDSLYSVKRDSKALQMVARGFRPTLTLYKVAVCSLPPGCYLRTPDIPASDITNRMIYGDKDKNWLYLFLMKIKVISIVSIMPSASQDDETRL